MIGPHIGAIVGVFGYKFLIAKPLAKKREIELEAMSVVEQQKGPRHSMGLKFKQGDHSGAGAYLSDINYGAPGVGQR